VSGAVAVMHIFDGPERRYVLMQIACIA